MIIKISNVIIVKVWNKIAIIIYKEIRICKIIIKKYNKKIEIYRIQ